jgi:hypothetical protein
MCAPTPPKQFAPPMASQSTQAGNMIAPAVFAQTPQTTADASNNGALTGGGLPATPGTPTPNPATSGTGQLSLAQMLQNYLMNPPTA